MPTATLFVAVFPRFGKRAADEPPSKPLCPNVNCAPV